VRQEGAIAGVRIEIHAPIMTLVASRVSRFSDIHVGLFALPLPMLAAPGAGLNRK
jgi:hypothetical protein